VNDETNNLDKLREFLKEEVQNEKKIALARSGFQSHNDNKTSFQRRNRNNGNDKVSTASALLTGSRGALVLFCEKTHESAKCSSADKLTLEEKTATVKKKNGCLACLGRNH